jgi:hypothetical protein
MASLLSASLVLTGPNLATGQRTRKSAKTSVINESKL